MIPGAVESQPVAEDAEERYAQAEASNLIKAVGARVTGNGNRPELSVSMPDILVPSDSTKRRRNAARKNVSVRTLINQSNGVSSSRQPTNPTSSFLKSFGNFNSELASRTDSASSGLTFLDPSFVEGESDATLAQSGRRFTGPLGELYPDDAILRPRRHEETIWAEVMQKNLTWQTHDAEESGFTTFWHAMLRASHCLNCAIEAMSTLAAHGQLKQWMVRNVNAATGQVANSIALAWEHDHLANLVHLSESEKLNLNIDAQERRHDQLLKRIWIVINHLDLITEQGGALIHMEALQNKFKEYYSYLTVTVKLVLEDALFFYRNAMTERDFTCVCHIKNSRGKIDPTLWSTVSSLVIGLTLPHRRMGCLSAMGYPWLASKAICAWGVLTFKWNFCRPLSVIQSRAAKYDSSHKNNGPCYIIHHLR